MSGQEEEFDDFLARRRKLFRAAEHDPLEPPEEIDRIVLRQAREAIQPSAGPRQIRGMSWGVPLAIAATLLLAFTVVLNVGSPKKAPVPEVSVETVAQRMDYPPATNNPASADAARAAPAAPAASQADSRAEAPPQWRRNSKTWLAEIQRLRAAGKEAEADAEMAEFRRHYRAYAGSPDR